ncbi:MAG: DUF1573 domain-containing protein [Candidatus Hydrogenedens sp.]|nr:DUF1573 domain-containing protein [Candidatus Hydrogenedens sp.]
MKIKLSYIVIAVLIALVVFVLLVANQQSISIRQDAALDKGLSPPVTEPMEDAPRVRVDEDGFNMGVIPRDRETTKTLRIHNDGKSPLEIKSLLTSCALCMKAVMANGKKIIAPGASAEVEITVFPSGVYGFYSKKTLSIGTNDPRRPKVNLDVEAWVDPEYVLEPENLDFGTIRKGEEAVATMRLRSLLDTPLEMTALMLSAEKEKNFFCPHLELSYEKAPEEEWITAGREEYIITARISPAAMLGPFQEYCFLNTDLERFETHLFNISGNIEAPYTFTLSKDSRGIQITARDQKVEGHLRCLHECTVSLEEDEKALVDMAFEQVDPGEWKISVVARDDLDAGLNHGSATLVIETEGQVYRECLPVFCLIPQAVR